ncbi:OprO/OprP family phosphate-selective porin [Acetobacter peroxydans]|jgi:phosphate-selective porin OprO/OprP|uniref:Porin n=1 Tax=Acetobacter peroxydans TaxID=104098 RepID=A0A4Y3TNS3_9PROT|nr:porin [Acetobacter peroxydans]NHO15628.1 porin [Acetobacter peroxydans]GBR34694.1 polyphosphate-selective porin O [Acetobacter peroxydans NBRC 13755]GBR42204.1 polyphosphate-selective porin O [Acetobacter peroxydans]GEB84661.1 porin [Acetobacter peroxydans]
MRLLSRSSLLLGSAASALFLSPVSVQAASDPELIALRHEMESMRGEIRRLQSRVAKYEHANVNPASENPHKHTPHHLRVAGPNEPQPVFNEPAPVRTGPRTVAESRVTVPEGPAMSWKDFKAASAKEESVHVGGIQIGFPNGRPTIASDDKAYAFSIGLLAQEDFGGFMGVGPSKSGGNFNNFTQNARRLRLYFSWRYKDWVVNVTPDFGSSTFDGSASLFEANINYTGLRHTTLTVGYFQPRMEEESAERSGAFEFLERPAIVDIVRNIASGVGRFSVGGEHYEKRWLVGGYFTGQKVGDRNKDNTITDSQTGAVVRAVGRPYVSKDIDVFMGAGATAAFKVNNGSKGRRYTASSNTEIPLGETNLLTSGVLSDVSQIWAVGPQLALRWKRFLLKSEYYHIGVQQGASVENPSVLRSFGFDGWYVAANYTLLGNPRIYSEKIGAFTAPGVTYDFDPAHNHWGALELSGRWSVTNLHDGDTGNQQTVWESGVNWYPNRHFRFMLDYQHFIVSRDPNSKATVNLLGTTGNAVVGRVQAAF